VFKYLCTFCLCVSGLSVNVQAIEIEDYVTEVIQTHPLLLQRVHNYRQMVQDEKIAAAGWRPSLDLTATIGNYNTNTPITNLEDKEYNSHNAELTLTQNIYAGHDTENSIKQARARMKSEIQRIYDDADNIALEAIGLYMSVLKEGGLTELAKRNVDSHEYILRKIREYSESGIGRKSDEKQTMSRWAQARSGLIAQQNNLQDALSKLHFYLGRYVHFEDLVTPEALVLPNMNIDELVNQAFENHPAMKSAHFNIEAASFDYERAKSEDRPYLDLKLRKFLGDDIGGYDGPTDEYSVALELTYNLYNGGATTANKRKKISGIYGHREFAARVRRQITQSLNLSWAASKALTMQSDYLADYVKNSNTTLELYWEEFDVGRRDLLDLLDAEEEYNTARVKLIEADLDRINATYRVHEGAGQLFDVMGLDVEMDEHELRIAAVDVNEVNELPYDLNVDKDSVPDVLDQCENTLPDMETRFGCATNIDPDFGYEYAEDTTERRVEQLNFIYDSVELSNDGNARLMLVIDGLKQKVKDYNIVEIHAHSDNVGTSKYNMALSKRRAMALKVKLVEAGFSQNRIRVFGHGENDPIATNDTITGRDKNRRVEFVIKHVYAN